MNRDDLTLYRQCYKRPGPKGWLYRAKALVCILLGQAHGASLRGVLVGVEPGTACVYLIGGGRGTCPAIYVERGWKRWSYEVTWL